MCGYVIDDYTQKPIQNCTVALYWGSFKDRKPENWPRAGRRDTMWYEERGYKRYCEPDGWFDKYLTGENGYFELKNCIIDYTYYVTVGKHPKGYLGIKYDDGINIKPKDSVKDSLIIKIKPYVVKGIVTNEKIALANVEIECETLYGKNTFTTGRDGKFEIIGPISEFIRFKHDNYRVMDVKINYDIYCYDDKTIFTIAMKKENKKMPFKGEYDWGKIKEIE